MKVLSYTFFITCFFLLTFFHLGKAQVLTHGPIIGAVASDSARVFIRTDSPTTFEIQLSTNDFITIARSFTGNTLAAQDNVAIVSLRGLQPETEYKLRVLIQGKVQKAINRFTTFPLEGKPSYIKFLSGSCMRDLFDTDTTIFKSMAREKPHLIQIYGDWGYPDSETGIQDVLQGTSYAADYTRVAKAYYDRYASSSSEAMLRAAPLNYVYDDHDYLNDNSGNTWAAFYNINPLAGLIGRPITQRQPLVAKQNVIRGYKQYFPHYQLAAADDGIYHSFKIGNAEFFVLDLRANRTPNHDALKNAPGDRWYYEEPVGHTLLGQRQKEWLKNALRSSTADWKFIISSVTFSKANQWVLDSCLKAGSRPVPLLKQQLTWLPGNISATGYIASSRYLDKWVGFRSEQEEILNFILQNNIRNCFIISGDTHTGAIDDGTFAGLPELMAAGIKVANRQEVWEYQNFMRFNAWNRGGSGLCVNDNFSTHYGKVEVFHRDSVKLSLIDPFGFVIASATFPFNAPYRYNPNIKPNRLPTPNDDSFTVDANQTTLLDVLKNDTDPEGDALLVFIKEPPAFGTVQVENNKVRYTPAPNYTGNDAFRYKACDTSNPECYNCQEALATVVIKPGTGVSSSYLLQLPTIQVYPNPVAQVLKVAFEQNYPHQCTFSLVSPLGQVVKVVEFNQSAEVSVIDIAGGYYLYTIFDSRKNLLKTGSINVLHR
ncbi:MAG: alkaline phosphatase D family protein [Bacteroidia bacterium]|nr:alkaline phosphatase D family protein [Bacteroidia bacterium]MDW8159645.1 alkaline phosphatase D family protein [Bacteroidia bacterium]